MSLLGRILARTALALWRQRLGLIVAALLVVAFGFYGLTFAKPSVTNGDCADTAMAALTHVTDESARAAYACLGPAMRTTNEADFVSMLRERAMTSGQADRVGDRQVSDGSKIVFYTVSASGTTPVGYIVYLDPDGKITKVE